MKTKVKLILTVVVMIALTLVGCKPKPVISLDPTVNTKLVANSLTKTGATISVSITGGNQAIGERGVYYAPLGTDIQSGTKLRAGSGLGSFSVELKDLSPNTKYSVKGYATTGKSGLILSINSTDVWTYAITDIDGNGYHTVVIGEQVWTVENLRVSHYRDGTLIPLGSDSNLAWSQLSTGARCYYDNDQANDSVYGTLYNWYAVDNKRGLAIEGWHIPSLNEWVRILLPYLGNPSLAGGKLKEVGTEHWQAPNAGATNSTGFTALPSGVRTNEGVFVYLQEYTYFWTSGSLSPVSAWSNFVKYKDAWLLTGVATDKTDGFSVRLVKNK